MLTGRHLQDAQHGHRDLVQGHHAPNSRLIAPIPDPMRLALKLTIFLVVAFAAYATTPFMALYRLGQAVEAGDAAGIEARVNLKALRTSLSRQILTTYLETSGQGERMSALTRGMAVAAGTSIADPLVARLISPEALAGLLRDGSIGGVTLGAPGGPSISVADGLRAEGLGDAWRLYMSSDLRGLREFVVAVPPGKPPEDQVGLQLRLADWTWKVHGVELPAGLRQKLAQELAQGVGRPS